MLSKELESCLNEAFRRASSARHEFVTVEHLLLAIVDTAAVREVLGGCGADPSRLAADLWGHVEANTLRRTSTVECPAVPQIGFQRVLQRAVFYVRSGGKSEVGVVDVLVASFSEKQSQAVTLLERAGVGHLDVVGYVERSRSPG
jgi:ATP-dependent Clp protease ATP-binding subunit ClpA